MRSRLPSVVRFVATIGTVRFGGQLAGQLQ
jgi:hypothetical protein